MKKILAFAAAGLLLLVAVLVVRTALLRSRQIRVAPISAGGDVAVDSGAAAARLAGALRFPTVSLEGKGPVDGAAFLALHRYLAASFPRAHAALGREVVASYSLLYTWPGRNPALPPLLLLSHLDVVPVEPGTERAWTQPPFAGTIEGGWIWGRGSLDDKVGVTAILEAVEALAAQGFRPERTVYLAFGHDEEVGGNQGALAIATLLASRGVRPEMILDEGGVILEGAVPGVDHAVALVGTAEKGSVSVELVAESRGGHSSMPPAHTAIGEVAAAVAALEAHPMPARIDGATRRSFEYLAPEMPFVPRLLLANLWLTAPLVEAGSAADPAANARVRTTTAATMIAGGVKENVLPLSARALVNFRILPGDTVASVVAHVRQTVGPGVKVMPHGNFAAEPTAESPVDSPAFQTIQRTLAEVFPAVVVAPNLLSGATDSRRYRHLSGNVYRFLPVRIQGQDLARLHGTNERVGVATYAEGVRFYARLIRNAAG